MIPTNTNNEKFYKSNFYDIGIEEREIRDLLRDNIGLIADNLTAPHTEFPLPSGRFIDILCKETTSNRLVVLELKRGESKKLVGQAISYAAEIEKKIQEGKLDSLNLDQEISNSINTDVVRIIVVSTDDTEEFKWTIEKLQKLKLDIQHVKILPYEKVDRFADSKVLLAVKNETPGFTLDQPTSIEAKSNSTYYELKIKEIDIKTDPLTTQYCVERIGRNEFKKEEIQEYTIDKNIYKAKINGEYIPMEPNRLRYTVWYVVNHLITNNIEPVVESHESRKFLGSLSISFNGKLNSEEFVKQAKFENFEPELSTTNCFIAWRYLSSDEDLIKLEFGKGRTYAVLNFQTVNDKVYLVEKFREYYNIEFEKQ